VEATSAEGVSGYLVALKLITPEQVGRAEDFRKSGRKVTFSQALVDSGEVSGDWLMESLARANGAATVEVDGYPLAPHVVHAIPENQAFAMKMIPVHRTEKILFVASSGKIKNGDQIAELEKQTGYQIEVIPVESADVPGLVTKCHQILKARSLRERRIGQALIERGLVTTEQLDMALRLQRQKNIRIGRAFTELGFISDKVFYEILAERLRLPLRENTFVVDRLQPDVCRKVTQSFAEHNMLLPFAKEDETLQVATSYPVDLNMLETLRTLTGAIRVEFILVDEAGLDTVIKAVYSGGELPKSSKATSATPAEQGVTGGRAMSESVGKAEGLDLEVTVEDVTEGEDSYVKDIETDPEVPRIINYMLYQAVKKGASDVHLEQYEDRADVKFRIDGQMRSISGIPIDRENVIRIISKLKIDALLDIAERRKPQDGSFRKRFGEKLLVDFRLATQPTLYGENAVIRILDRTSPLPTIPQLGMPDRMLKRYRRQIASPQGMVIFTGPTGSGKTTTLYCTLEVLRKQALKIITAEDPIEYQFDGIQQCQVNEHIGNTFAKYLRGFLRQDPDVILIGEVRDEETAVSAVRAAITGHLIFTTIHASDTIGIIRRFIDMGVDTNMLSMSLVAVIYQRLVRRICVNCKEPYDHDAEEVKELQLDEIFKGVQLFRGRGCEACDGTGFRGRIAAYEMWEPGDLDRDEISSNVDERVLRTTSIKGGLKPLVVDAVTKVKAGITTLDEMQEVIPFNQIVRAKEFFT
jgi:type IV pilus assembly protein PilB